MSDRTPTTNVEHSSEHISFPRVKRQVFIAKDAHDDTYDNIYSDGSGTYTVNGEAYPQSADVYGLKDMTYGNAVGLYKKPR